MAGKAGGKLVTNQHVRIVGESVSKVPFTVLTAMGSTATSFGLGQGQATSTVSQLLA